MQFIWVYMKTWSWEMSLNVAIYLSTKFGLDLRKGAREKTEMWFALFSWYCWRYLHCSADTVGVICTVQLILLALFALFRWYCRRYLHCSADTVGVITKRGQEGRRMVETWTRNANEIWMRNLKGEKRLERRKMHRWQNNTGTDNKETCCESVEWIEMEQ